MRRLLPIAAFLAWAPARADEVPDGLMAWYNALAQRGEAALKAEGVEAAIRIYNEALFDARGEYGRVHLRLGQLHQQANQAAPAAKHFLACDADTRVDAMDRELICQEGYRSVTVVLTVEDLPPRGRVVVVEPALFAGPFESGGRLPHGEVHVEVEAPGRKPAGSTIPLEKDTTWAAVLGPPRSDPPPIPANFIAPDGVPPPDDDPSARGERASWPYLLAGGVAAGMIGGGLYLGFDSQSQVDGVRDRQAGGRCGAGFCAGELDDANSQAFLADGLWIGGVAVAVGTTALWFLLGEAAPDGGPP